MQPIQLTSRGRLDREKGRARLLPTLRSLCQSSDIPPFAIHIYGDGTYATEVITLAAEYPENIFYYGRQSLETINHKLRTTHYSLMPSLFLETFGLTALESLRQGVPVIGYRKGGLEPFIFEGLDITDYPGDNSIQLENSLRHILTTHTDTHWHKLHTQAKEVASHYTAQHFIDQITQLAGDTLPHKILMVSDYTNPLGGIETYLTKVQELLQSQGSEVIIIGGSREKNATWKKYLQMIGTIRNPLLRHKITTAIQTHHPDLIRYHSILRNIGRAGIMPNPDGQTRVTYHDLGLMHPFPSRVYSADQIKPGLIGRLSESKRYQRLLVTVKYISVLLIRKKLAQTCQLHLIPSPFLQSMITWVTPEKVKAIGHFVTNI